MKFEFSLNSLDLVGCFLELECKDISGQEQYDCQFLRTKARASYSQGSTSSITYHQCWFNIENMVTFHKKSRTQLKTRNVEEGERVVAERPLISFR